MEGEDPPHYGFPGLPDDYAPPIRASVRHPRQLGEDMLRSQQAAAAERAAAGGPQMQQVIHGAGGQAQANAAAREEQARMEFVQAFANQMRAQQQNQQAAQQAAEYAAVMNQHAQQPVYRPQQPQAPVANPYYQAHMQQNPQQAVQQQWFGGEDAQAMQPAAQRPAAQYAQAQQMQLDMLRRQQAAQQALVAHQQIAARAAAQLAAAQQAPNVHVHVVAGPQQLGVDMAARDARAGDVARVVHALVHGQPYQVQQGHQVQMPVHNQGVYMMRAQPPAGPHEAPDVRAARIKAEREANEEADNLARRYSRACFICTNPNPLRRAVLVACGHIVCSPCAEEAKGASCHLKCPFCRKPSTFVKIFEDEAKEDEERHFEDGMDESESPSTNEPVQ